MIQGTERKRERIAKGGRWAVWLSVILMVGMALQIMGFGVSAKTSDLPTEVIPGGMPFGVSLKTDGVLVVGLSSADGKKNGRCPAKDAGICVRDILLSVDGTKVTSVEEVTERIRKSGGKSLTVTLRRGEEVLKRTVTPILSSQDRNYRAGLWIRDSAAGIGTVTFLCPQSHGFAGLGHGICDPDTGMLIPVRRGTVMNVRIGSVKRGKAGIPGELKGSFSGGKTGTLLTNTECGAYGVLSVFPTDVAQPIPVGKASDVHTGDAYLLSTCTDVSQGGQVCRYRVRIRKIYDRNRRNKNFLLEVTDPELIRLTGGIVRGMSGSPIIQDGKLIGALTHVMVEDPTRGYGILIGNMLEQMPELIR